MIIPASSNLLFLFVFFCDTPPPSQEFRVPEKPTIWKTIHIDTTKSHKIIYSPNTPKHHLTQRWIYPNWIRSRDSIPTKRRPYLWYPGNPRPPLQQSKVVRAYGGGAFILGPPDTNP